MTNSGTEKKDIVFSDKRCGKEETDVVLTTCPRLRRRANAGPMLPDNLWWLSLVG